MKKILTVCCQCMLLLLLSCSKESDKNSPSVTIVQPVNGSVYSVGDTLWISAVIRDDSKLESIKVSLLDQDQKPVLGSLVFTPPTSEYTLNAILPIDDIHLKGGTYTLQVKAFDGTNFTNAFTEILINEIPSELKSVVLISREGIYGTGVSILNGNVWQKVITLNGDYKASDISSFDQLIFTAGALSGNLNAFLFPADSVVWEVPLMSSPPYRYFEDLFFSSPLLYVAYYNGSIKGYDYEGNVIYSTYIFGEYFPGHLGIVNNMPIAVLQSKTGQVSLLAVYYQESGNFWQSVNLPMKVIAFETEDDDNVLVFGNDGNTGKIMEYTLSLNKLRLLRDFPDGMIGAVAHKDGGNFFIAGNTAVHWYIRPTNTLVEFLTAAPAALIDFDVVNNRLYAVSNHYLAAYDVPGGQQVLNIPVADSALALHLLYNK